MKNYNIVTVAFAFFCLLLTNCVAVSKRKAWRWHNPKFDYTSTSYVPYIKIDLVKEVIWIPTPIIMAEINCSRNYLLDIDFHTGIKSEYSHLDSVQYSIITLNNQVVNAGVLPIKNGDLYIRSYSPGIYRAQCTTAASIPLGKQRQPLNGTFTIYATDIKGHLKAIHVTNVVLDYYRPRIMSFF